MAFHLRFFQRFVKFIPCFHFFSFFFIQLSIEITIVFLFHQFPGMALSNFTLCVSEYCSLEQLPAAFGWHMIGKGLFVTAFGPLIGIFRNKFCNFGQNIYIAFTFSGWIRDYSGSYPICIHAQTFCIFLCCLAWTIEYIINYVREHKKDDCELKTTDTATATTNSTVTTPGNNK